MWQNNPFTFEAFFKENYSRLVQYLLQMLDETDECCDIAADAFEALYKRREQLSPPQWKPYLYTVARNMAVSHIRHSKAASHYADFLTMLYGKELTTTDTQQLEDSIERMHKVIESLSPRTRQVLTLCYFNQMKYADVAKELAISISAVKKHIVTAFKILRKEMKN